MRRLRYSSCRPRIVIQVPSAWSSRQPALNSCMPGGWLGLPAIRTSFFGWAGEAANETAGKLATMAAAAINFQREVTGFCCMGGKRSFPPDLFNSLVEKV